MHPGLWVHVIVLSAWANLLKYEESLRSKNCEIRRLFCSAVMLMPANFENNLETRLRLFKESMGRMLRSQNLTSLTDVGPVLIPIMDSKHYYLMVFNIKKCHIWFIDNMMRRGNFRAVYRSKPEIMREAFAAYLSLIGHAAGTKIGKYNFKRVDISWATKENFEDCGVFVMRHMETFKGDVGKLWFKDCGLSAERKK